MMLLLDVVELLRARGLQVNEGQVRWAMRTGKVPQPGRDRSLRFNFSAADVSALEQHFRSRQPVSA